MTQLTILSGKAMIVELPEGAHSPVVDDYLLGYNLPPPEWAAGWGDESYDTINLPPGNWRIIGLLSEVTETEASELVDYFTTDEDFGKEDVFRDYKGEAFYDTALESLESAILAEGYYLDKNPLGDQHPELNNGQSGYDHYDDAICWAHAQSRVLDRSRCLLLGKEG